MICMLCKEAGFSLGRGNVDHAKVLHSACPGGDKCTCKHRIDTSILKPREDTIRDETTSSPKYPESH
jgi:hypothetical protein